jgi:hypothetical protein
MSDFETFNTYCPIGGGTDKIFDPLREKKGTSTPFLFLEKKRCAHVPSNSLFDMGMGDTEFFLYSEPRPESSVPTTAQPRRFYPIDEFKDLSLQEILALDIDNDDDDIFKVDPLSEDIPEPITPATPPGNAPHLVESTVSQVDVSSRKRLLELESYPVSVDSSVSSPESTECRFRPYQAGRWFEMFYELADYRQKNGHCVVPRGHKENVPLGGWVKRQRHQHKLLLEGKRSTLTPDRVKALEELGFVWDSQETKWSQRLHELIAFHMAYFHCNVTPGANPQLVTWIKCQRCQYKLYCDGKPSHLSPQRIHELEKIGFQWEVTNRNKKAKLF